MVSIELLEVNIADSELAEMDAIPKNNLWLVMPS